MISTDYDVFKSYCKKVESSLYGIFSVVMIVLCIFEMFIAAFLESFILIGIGGVVLLVSVFIVGPRMRKIEDTVSNITEVDLVRLMKTELTREEHAKNFEALAKGMITVARVKNVYDDGEIEVVVGSTYLMMKTDGEVELFKHDLIQVKVISVENKVINVKLLNIYNPEEE